MGGFATRRSQSRADRPCSYAYAVAAARDDTRSLAKMLLTWRSTVRPLRTRSAAIALLVYRRRSAAEPAARAASAHGPRGGLRRQVIPAGPGRAPHPDARRPSGRRRAPSPRCRRHRGRDRPGQPGPGPERPHTAPPARATPSTPGEACRTRPEHHPLRVARLQPQWRRSPQQRRVEFGGDVRQLVGRCAGHTDVIGCELDLDGGGQHPGPRGAILSTSSTTRRIVVARGRRRPPAPTAARPARAAGCVPTGAPVGRHPPLRQNHPEAGAARPLGSTPSQARGGPESRSRARCASSKASGQSPCSRMISARYARHCPR